MDNMIGIWAIVDTTGKCIDIYEGDLLQFSSAKYENYGGEIGVHGDWTYREAAVGKTFNHELDKFI